jgi:hypothetical protein
LPRLRRIAMPGKSGKGGPGGVRTVRIKLKKPNKISSREVEEAIAERLASRKTDVFGNNDALIILVEQQKGGLVSR